MITQHRFNQHRFIQSLFISIVLVALASLAGCTQGLRPTPIKEAAPIKIGWIGPLTGTGAPYGVPALNGATLAVEDLNAKGGINGRKIELVIEDGKCDGAAASSAVNKLIEVDAITYILGGHCSTESLVMAPIIEAKGAFILAGATGTNTFTGIGKHTFRTFPPAKYIYAKLAEFAYTKGTRTVVTFSEEKDWPQSVVESFATRFTQIGGNIIGKETYTPGTSDFRTQLLKIKNFNPNAVMISVQGPDSAAQIIKQMSELGLKIPIYGDALVVSKSTYDKTQGLLPSTAIGGSPHVNIKKPATKAFYEAYKKTFPEPGVDPFITTESYDSATILAELIKACGDDIACARKEITSREFTGVTGRFRFGLDGDPINHYIGIVRIENGDQVFEYEGE